MNEGDDGAHSDWAQLVCVTDTETPPLMIGKDKFTIGRARGCDVCHENNKLVSGTHCYILRDETGKVWLYDSSTNGTLLNSKTKLTKGECREIIHGDEFFVVYKKGDEDLNIGYVFQDLVKLREEEEDESDILDQTLEYETEGPPQVDSTIADDQINIVDEEEERIGTKRTLDQTGGAGPAGKRSKTDKDVALVDSTPTTTAVRTTTTPTSKASTTNTTAGGGTHSAGASSQEDPADKAVTKSGAALSVEAVDSRMEGQKGGGGEGENDMFAETLTCIICQELLHDCISLQPCMHSFCAGCYSEWMAHSSECPSCRMHVDRINKNHIVNNLVEAYLKENPEKRRPEEDLKELDAKNKITRDMLYPKRRRNSSSDYSDSEPDDGDDETTPTPAAPPPAPHGLLFGYGTPVFGASNAFRAICRQCPSSSENSNILGKAFNAVRNLITGATTTSTPAAPPADTPATSGTDGHNNNNNNDSNNNPGQPSTSGAGPSGGGSGDAEDRDKKVMPTPPQYQCAPNQNHVLCQCCLQIFPDRRTERLHNPALPPQQCTVCFRAFCHAYWGCRNVACNGCLAKFKDLKFGKKVLTSLIMDNLYESEILKDYLETKGLAVQDVLNVCLEKMQEGTYTCPDQARYNMTGETPLCYACGLRNFKVLAYQYRFDIPPEELPATVTARPDCYWGKNCRTQRNRPQHAQRFNHICNQTRT